MDDADDPEGRVREDRERRLQGERDRTLIVNFERETGWCMLGGATTSPVLLAALIGWLDHRQQEALAYLIEENRIPRVSCLGGACS